MKTIILLFLAFFFLTQCRTSTDKMLDHFQDNNCICDTIRIKEVIADKYFNRIEKYDTSIFQADSLYSLSEEENMQLWYRDIENPDTTKFTKYWDDYKPTNYHANHFDFVKYYENKPGIEIAFQLGPNFDLWAYHIFVIKKIHCCYLVTRSYFRHARFTYKAYSIIDRFQLDSLFETLRKVHKEPISPVGSGRYRGYFVDNRNKTKFYVDFEKEVIAETGKPKAEVKNLYEFIDSRIKWRVTYE